MQPGIPFTRCPDARTRMAGSRSTITVPVIIHHSCFNPRFGFRALNFALVGSSLHLNKAPIGQPRSSRATLRQADTSDANATFDCSRTMASHLRKRSRGATPQPVYGCSKFALGAH